MLVPYSWLKEFVSVSLSPEELAERLTLTGLEVEGVFDAYEDLAQVVSVRVLAVSPHPHADKLTVCKVTDGAKNYQVVCGAKNVREGLKTAFAPQGVILFTGEKIAAKEIKGVLSEGMLCSPYEIGLSLDHSGILELPEDTPLGKPVTEILGLSEPVLEVALTPNRGDCLSIYGMAREVAAVCNASLKKPELPNLPLGEDIFSETSVTIEVPELCFRYAGRLIKNVQVKESPFEIQQRLWLCGLRPINNIVDITNYVLLEVGQPLHAFDFDLLEGKKIIVRLARAGEKILTLDGVERTLDTETMVIADAKRPVAIAGIMGGEETAVTEKTRNVFLESAWFNPSSIRLTSQRLRLSSESSYRFERGVDPEGVILGLERAAKQMADLAHGEVILGRIDEYPSPYAKREIRLSPKRIKLYLKVDLTDDEITRELEKVQVKVTKGVEDFICEPPSFRHDISLPEDLIEEIARLYGYDKLPSSIPVAEIAGKPPSRYEKVSKKVKCLLRALGLYEVINYSFISPQFVSLLGLDENDLRAKPLALANPLSEEQAVMRTTLIPGLLQTAKTNIFRERPDVKIFELGRVFLPRKGEVLPEERHYLSGLLTGRSVPISSHRTERHVDFFDLKGILESFFENLGVKNIEFVPKGGEPFLLPALSVLLEVKGQKIGFAGALRPKVRDILDIEQEVFVFEIDFEKVLEAVSFDKRFRALPKFPATTRDLALILQDAIPAQELLSFAKELSLPHLEEVTIIDVYRGKPIPEGYKSLTLRFVYRAPDRTLTDEEVNKIQEKVTEKFLARFEAKLR
ncbi:phenylalanine--tRNA ligase subunit beta [Thermodesulfatator atlanticus]|uniref:phenylalanine--tRNA ligase subunit beta n=1 Tax=Thermodesulfatator atlanticus TaxID=501497 RepID=UPI0003B54D6D|nr:phenylalanine--tRNA ligase subunit beta [Thermodesulfatator atlanticus]